MLNKVILLLLLLPLQLLTITTPAIAKGGVKGELGKIFRSMGSDANVTGAGSFRDQSGGYYTGGSVFVRNPVQNASLMDIQAPSFRAGCGGIDLFTGGFSYISSEKLVAMLKSIGSNAASYSSGASKQRHRYRVQ